PKLAQGPEEKALFTALDAAEAVIAPAMETENFTAAMAAMADLRAPLRNNPGSDAPLEAAIRAAIALKPKGHDFDYSRQSVDGRVSRHMSHTGG
ncbi:MAG: hypothetical protein RQ750_09855, partial [Roseovarius sp.]|nr:hypothetical protein [Roseovarius sp.]